MAFTTSLKKFGIDFPTAYAKIDHVMPHGEDGVMVFLKVWANKQARTEEAEPITIINAVIFGTTDLSLKDTGKVYKTLRERYGLTEFEDA